MSLSSIKMVSECLIGIVVSPGLSTGGGLKRQEADVVVENSIAKQTRRLLDKLNAADLAKLEASTKGERNPGQTVSEPVTQEEFSRLHRNPVLEGNENPPA